MVPVASPVENITIERDLHDGRWHVHAGPASAIVRAWTWGERRRLLELATAGGALDRALFTRGLLDLLVDGGLPSIEPSVFAFLCLYLLGVPQSGRMVPLARAELLAATTFGWPPQYLDAQPAGDIDRLIAQLEPIADLDDGWTHIVVVPDASSSIEARLESMLRTLARLVGVGEASAESPASPVPAVAAPPAPETAQRTQPDRPFEPTFRGTARLRRGAPSSSVTTDYVPEPQADDPKSASSPPPRIARLTSHLAMRGGSAAGARPLSPPDRESRASIAVVSPSDSPDTPDVRTGGDDDVKTPTMRVSGVNPDVEASRIRRTSPATELSSHEPRPAAFPGVSLHVRARRVVEAPPVSAGRPETRASTGVVRERAASNRRSPAFEDHDCFPTFGATLRWPDAASGPEGPDLSAAAARVPDHPFERSELEERVADVLERAAREAGIDVP